MLTKAVLSLDANMCANHVVQSRHRNHDMADRL